MEKTKNPLYCDALIEGKPYEIGDWKNIPEIKCNHFEIKGFFGENRWLSNFSKAIILLDGMEYSSVEKAYQAAKWKPESREYFTDCTNEQAIKHNREFNPNGYSDEEWNLAKLEIMASLIDQKFNPVLNPENCIKLLDTGDKYLEETNWWNDTFWGKDLEGNGENNLGNLLMQTRDKKRK